MELIGRDFYDAILNFEKSRDAQNKYYEILFSKTGKILPDGKEEIIRDLILRSYATLFCDDMNLPAGALAGIDEIEATADRLYVGEVGLDPDHWYRMRHHFPVIDEDNYVRFASLVISDLKVGDLHDGLKNGKDMLIVGEADPLHMTSEQRKTQKTFVVDMPNEGGQE